MPDRRMKHRRVVHKSTAGILKPVPEAVGLVGNPPPGLTNNTVALPRGFGYFDTLIRGNRQQAAFEPASAKSGLWYRRAPAAIHLLTRFFSMRAGRCLRIAFARGLFGQAIVY